MSAPLLWATAAMYLWVAGEQGVAGNWPMAGAFFAYAVANLCFSAAMR